MSDTPTAWNSLARLREQAPLVQCITNYVAMDVSANVLLSLGAAPAMAHAAEEVEDFVAIASALMINIGTLSPPWVAAMERAADRAAALGRPWVLDPVGAGATPYRTEVARDLARRRPTIIRGNASEILAVAGELGGTRGVDSTRTPEQARALAEGLARELGCVVAVTGKVDHVTDGRRTLAVAHGDPLLTRVTAMGCALSAVAAAFAAVDPDPLTATSHALALFGLCGERAADGASGPGSFRVRMIDALAQLDPGHRAQLRVTELHVG